jgi:hypothetical protein
MAANERDFSSSSKYDIYSKLMLIASKYFDVTNEDFLKTGLFGYVTESMAMIARDSSFHKSMLYNEAFLNTAVMPKSIYNWAKMFGVSIPAATPAYADIQVTIPIDSLYFQAGSAWGSAYGAEVTGALANKQMMIIDRSNQFVAGEFRFTMERSILLYKDTVSGTDEITVKYCETEAPSTILQDLSNYYITTVITDNNFISFVVRAYQYDLTTVERQISSPSFLDTKIHRFQFSDQFVGAKLRYTKNGVTTPIELRFSNISTPEQTTASFAYYNLVDEDTVQVTFSSASGDFMPSSNSTLEMDIFTTRGAAGNITFTGDVIIRLSEEKIKNVPILANFFSDSAIGGVDTPSLSRIKSTIINEISTRDVIVTEGDLNSYFSVLTSLLETINDGKVTFVKRRDDILRRVFSAYVLMRDGLDIDGNPAETNYTSKVIPTNTISADFAISANVSKPFGTIIKRKEGVVGEYEYVPESGLDGSQDYYVVPFFMRVTLDPFRKVKYIYNLTDDSTSLSYRSVSSNSTSQIYVLPSSISIKRELDGANASSSYILTASLVTNFDMSDDVLPSDTFNLSFYRKGNDTTPINSAALSYTSGNGLTISSVLSDDGESSGRYITTMQFVLDVANDGTEFDFSSEEANNNYGTFITVSHNAQQVSLPEDVKVQVNFVNFQGNLNLEFISDKHLLMFRNLDELMFSDVTLNKVSPRWNIVAPGGARLYYAAAHTGQTPTPVAGDYFIDSDDNALYQYTNGTTIGAKIADLAAGSSVVPTLAPTTALIYYHYYDSGTGVRRLYKYDSNEYVTSVRIKDIPVVHQSFFSDESNQSKFIRQLFVYIDTLRENLGKLETNTFFDLKFYNTYGESQYYNTDRTDLDLELDVYVFEFSDDLATAIRDYVRLLVDSANSNGALRVSTLIKDLTTNFGRYIDHVDFRGLNGTFTQYVSQIETVTKNLYAPEHLNISEENLAKINVIQLAQ